MRPTQGGYPGIGRATEGMVLGLLNTTQGHRFSLLYTHGKYVPPQLVAAVRSPHRLLPISSALRSVRDQWETAVRLTQARVDLYHSAYYAQALRPGRPYLLTVHDLIPERYPQYWPRIQGAAIRQWQRHAARGAVRISAPSEATATDLVTIYGIARSHIAVIPEAADAGWLGLSSGSRTPPRPRSYLLCVCTNKPHKNLCRLIQAYGLAARVTQPMPDLVIAGGWDTRYPEAARAAARLNSTLQGTARTEFVHNPDDNALRDLYRGAVGFIFPSEYEGFGLPVLEAMQVGLPVAASTTPAVAELAGEACIPFDPLDLQSIAGAIGTLLADEQVREHLRGAGLARARQFSWHHTAEHTLALYEEIL